MSGKLPGTPDEMHVSVKVPTVEDALEHPENYEVSLNWLGWGLQEIGEGVTLCLSDADAVRIVAKMQEWRNGQKPF